MVFHNLPANHIIGQLRGGGGGGVQAFHFGANDFELAVRGEDQTRPDILRVVLGPCAQYYPCEASEQQKSKLKEKELSY